MFLRGTIVGSVGESREDLSEFWRDDTSEICVWIVGRTRAAWRLWISQLGTRRSNRDTCGGMTAADMGADVLQRGVSDHSVAAGLAGETAISGGRSRHGIAVGARSGMAARG